jgi:hypothetical protein
MTLLKKFKHNNVHIHFRACCDNWQPDYKANVNSRKIIPRWGRKIIYSKWPHITYKQAKEREKDCIYFILGVCKVNTLFGDEPKEVQIIHKEFQFWTHPTAKLLRWIMLCPLIKDIPIRLYMYTWIVTKTNLVVVVSWQIIHQDDFF